MAFKPLEQVIKEFNTREQGVFTLPSFVHMEALDMPETEQGFGPDTESISANFGPNTYLEDLNRQFTQGDETVRQAHTKEESPVGEPEKAVPIKKKKKKYPFLSMASSFLFYFVIIGAVVMAFVSAGKNGNGARDILGYSYFTVLSSSMQDEIPKGSLVITKSVDERELETGDNITFLKDANTTVTHQIVNIYNNYDGKGSTGFQTKGVNNAQADRDVVDSSNVVGKVVFSIPKAGALLELVADNLLFVMGFLGMLLLLSFSLQVFFKIRKEEKKEAKTKTEQSRPEQGENVLPFPKKDIA